MGDLRPILLCNILYKVASKVLATKMQYLLHFIMSDTQSAFMPGRLITDNILISFEVMHYLKRKRRGNDGFMAIKLNMSRAYDRVEWDFIRDILLQMGFHENLVKLIMVRVCSVKYTVTHGMHEIGQIYPSRGIKQGDPLSPYLFILCTEELSELIKRYKGLDWLHGVRVAGSAPTISHMLYSDDSYIFRKAIEGEASKLMELLATFEEASGQKVFTKSSIFFSPNNSDERRGELCRLMGMMEADENNKYLRLQNCMGRKKSTIFGYLKDGVR